MNERSPERVGAAEVRRRMLAGENTLLVSVFPEAVHRFSHLDGAISLEELNRRLDSLDKRTNLVFY